MQLSTSFLFTTLCALALVSSQNLSQETDTQLVAQFPSCVLACDKAAIATVGCAETDYACHCAHTSPLQSIIVPCLLNSSNCTPADLTTFGTLVKQICLNLNVTGNATSTSTPSSTPSPFQGAASLPQSSIGLVSALVAAFVFTL